MALKTNTSVTLNIGYYFIPLLTPQEKLFFLTTRGPSSSQNQYDFSILGFSDF